MILDVDRTITNSTLENLTGKIALQDSRQENLYRHLSSPDYTGLSVTLIDKTDGSHPKKREDYWMKTLKTMAPYGLNIEYNV